MSRHPEAPIPMARESLRPAENFAVLSPKEFARSFSGQIQRITNHTEPTGVRVGVEAMWVEFFGQDIQPVSDALIAAARRGSSVEVHRDWFSQTNLDESFVWFPPTEFARRFGKDLRRHRMLVSGFNEKRREMLENAGGVVTETNIPKGKKDAAMYLFGGRNHKKIFFVTGADTTVAWTGGMNLAREHFKMLDCMVEFTDPNIVRPLVDEFARINDNRRTKSAEVVCTDDTSLLIDALGDKSIITDKAIEVVNAAQESLHVMSALHPEGKFLDALNSARERGVHVAFITVDPKLAGLMWGGQIWFIDVKATVRGKRIPLLFPDEKLVHGKMIVADEREAIIGSSNFTPASHEELSVYSNNPTLVKNLVGFLHSRVGKENVEQKVRRDTIIKLPAHEA